MEPDYSYIKGDLTGHYRPEKLDSFLRSFLFLNLKRDDVPAVVIIYDQVTARNPEFKKTWLLHSIEQPIVDGNVTTIMRTSDGYGGKLVNTTVLPAAAEIRTVGGPGLECGLSRHKLARNDPRDVIGQGRAPGAWKCRLKSRPCPTRSSRDAGDGYRYRFPARDASRL